MKNFPLKQIIIVGSIAIASSAYANHQQVSFPFHKDGAFYCRVAGTTQEVAINTHNIEIKGACSGKYVTRAGHLKMPANEVNRYYFEVVQPEFRTGNVTIDTPKGVDLSCVGTLIYNTGNRIPFNPSPKTPSC